MNLRCAIIDDEPLAVSLLESYVQKTPFLKLVGKYNSPLTAMAGIKSNPVDLLFLDIQMPELSGMEFAKLVDQETRIIFTTAFGQYALESYRTNALDYLLKPISYKDFLDAANKGLQWFELSKAKSMRDEEITPAESKEFFYVKSEHRLIKINMEEITFIEGLKDYIRINLEGKKPILSLMRMRSLEDFLPADRFMRVHRSFIVNLEKIEVMERARIVFGKNYIPVSDNCIETIREYIQKHSIL